MQKISLKEIKNRMFFPQTFESDSPKYTSEIAKNFAKIIKKGDNIFLTGDLGTGKTFFTKELLTSLETEDFVNSPSFKLINEYRTKSFKILHFDLYRLENVDEILYLGWEEMMTSDAICIVEWAERAKNILPEKRYEISFEHFFQHFSTKKKEVNKRMIKIIKID